MMRLGEIRWVTYKTEVRFEPAGKTVFISGASSGIGRACAIEFHRCGARVVAAARSFDKLQALATDLGDERFLPVKLDVTHATERSAAMNLARDRFGSVDVLVNNAGWASFGSFARIPSEHIERMFDLNVLAPVALIRELLPDMIQRRCGQIINVSSVVGIQPIPRMTVYSATKAALAAMSTGLRMELRGAGIDVILISPSSTRTAFFDSAAITDTRTHRFARTQYTAERVARAVVKASRHRRREVVLSVEGKTISLIRRFSHRAADAIMFHVAKRAMPVIQETS